MFIRSLTMVLLAGATAGNRLDKNRTFHQCRLILDGYGPLELTDQGMKRKIRAANINE